MLLNSIKHIFRLGLKEIKSFLNDKAFLIFVIWGFTLNIITQTKSQNMDIHNASIGVVNEDNSALSYNIIKALRQPFFKTPEMILYGDIDEAMDSSKYTFTIVIPYNFQSNLLAGKTAEIQLNIDGTVMTQAYVGSGYIKQIITQEIETYLQNKNIKTESYNFENIVRAKYNANLDSKQFSSITGIINLGTMLSMMLTAIALVREKESGTIEHLLVMPLTPKEIMLSKIWSNSAIILFCMFFSIRVIVIGYFNINFEGSLLLFFIGFIIFQFNVTSLGILLSTFANNTAQLALLCIAVNMPMSFLSGLYTPMESMAPYLQKLMYLSPLKHCVDFAIPIAFRGADITEVWKPMIWMFGMGFSLFYISSKRFTKWFNNINR